MTYILDTYLTDMVATRELQFLWRKTYVTYILDMAATREIQLFYWWNTNVTYILDSYILDMVAIVNYHFVLTWYLY